MDAGRKLCKISWNVLEHKYKNVDPNTPPNRLSGRCFDIALISALLKRLSVGEKPNGSTIELSHKIGKMDVDWTVGVAVNALKGNDIVLGQSSSGLILGKYEMTPE